MVDSPLPPMLLAKLRLLTRSLLQRLFLPQVGYTVQGGGREGEWKWRVDYVYIDIIIFNIFVISKLEKNYITEIDLFLMSRFKIFNESTPVAEIQRVLSFNYLRQQHNSLGPGCVMVGYFSTHFCHNWKEDLPWRHRGLDGRGWLTPRPVCFAPGNDPVLIA
jgi:hypothetical protein